MSVILVGERSEGEKGVGELREGSKRKSRRGIKISGGGGLGKIGKQGKCNSATISVEKMKTKR